MRHSNTLDFITNTNTLLRVLFHRAWFSVSTHIRRRIVVAYRHNARIRFHVLKHRNIDAIDHAATCCVLPAYSRTQPYK